MSLPVANLLKQVTTRRDNIAARWEGQYDPMMRNDELWTQITGICADLQSHLFRYHNDGAGPIPADPEPVHRCTECDLILKYFHFIPKLRNFVVLC